MYNRHHPLLLNPGPPPAASGQSTSAGTAKPHILYQLINKFEVTQQSAAL